jgi:uncharacterized protein
MQSNVVEAIEDGFSQAGFTTLKFNFRGVGGSTGHYADGIGEAADVLAACSFLKGRIGKDERFVLAGYSFGAWVAGMAVSEIDGPVDLFLVAYPFSTYSPEGLNAFKGRIYFVGGSYDDISPVDDLRSFYNDLECEKYLKILPSSHFFNGLEREIADFVVESFGREKG